MFVKKLGSWKESTMKKYFIFLFLFSTFLYANENYISLNYISQSDNFDFQFVLAESENMIDFKVSKILDLENVITGKYDFSLVGEKIRYYEKVILFDGKEYAIEKVKIELWSEDDLYNETRGTGSRGLTFEDFFAEENDYIKVISIDVAGNHNLFGTYLFVVNENTIITEYSGVYYLLEPVCSQEELIKINPTYFSKNDSIEYIGFIKIDNTLYKFYQNKHLFNDYRMTWRLIVIRGSKKTFSC